MKCTVIGIAGGTGSGKSTFTNRIKTLLNDDVSVIYHDNYYKRNDNMTLDERRKINYDHPDALETDLLIEHINILKRGTVIQCPVYDFAQHNRTERTVQVEPKRIIIVEGIMVLQDERLYKMFDIKIYVEADADERILRRAIRDIEERGRDLKGVAEQYLETVKPMHYLYVEPTKSLADIIINSGKNDVAFDLVTTKLMDILRMDK